MKHNNKWKKPDIETTVFLFFLIGMAVYYGWRLVALIPWYDELYTYYYFISRGPVYAAIHWPLPNNHVGYSTLSACLGIFGSPAVALRGVSYLCSLGSLVFIFRIGRKLFEPGMALIPVFLFAGLNLVNNLAVQGRGYALVTFCYLIAIWELLSIVAEGRDRTGNYMMFGISLVIALWAIPSSVYVVVPICLIGGWVALLQKEYKQLIGLVITSLISAVCTVGLYAVIWLAIGSNLLSKTPDNGCYGQGHIDIILHAPFAAMRTGIEYMLDTPYIQSVSRTGFSGQFKEWLQTLFGTHFAYVSGGHKGIVYAIIFMTSVIFLIGKIIRQYKNREYPLFDKYAPGNRSDDALEAILWKRYEKFTVWYLLLTIILLPLFLIIQCTLPYYRVFSFAGVMVALLITWLVQCVIEISGAGDRLKKYIYITAIIVSGILCLGDFCVNSQPYSMRDELVKDAYEQIDIENMETIAVTDCDQEYLLLYLYGIGEERVTRQISEADVVLVDKYLLGRDYDYREMPEEWKFYLTQEEMQPDYLEQEMEPVYENWQFVLYVRR
ncbi:MAG: glycosyltransferase family 39 protein [Lachnospiraceae bacterium]|nr:glycosyltransferase family 39 protein [Lachnospiraceae bacterium]